MGMQKYEVKLGNLTVNGKKCSKPSIELIGTEGILLNCTDEKKGVYNIQVPDGVKKNKCFEFLVSCDECKTCDQTKIIKCLCDSTDDCASCSDCVDGFCITKCKPDETCHEDRCVNCVTAEDCPTNQECIDGNCGCRAGLYKVGDKCVDCTDSNQCGDCEVCGPNGCETKDCGTGQCDPTTGDCAECINSTACGPNEICVNGSCVCADGYVRIDGICQPAPQCTFDTDCGSCMDCINGNCTPRNCPNGFVCIGDKCVEECDCERGGCSQGYTCTGGSGDFCGCILCEGSCAEGCSDPCYCSNGVCVDNPCKNKPCTDGTQCAQGCGCYNGTCTPCATIPCNGLESGCDAGALGCECVNGNCVDSDDACNNAPCETHYDCALGCTCDGGVCTSCDNYSCPEGCAGKDGCVCVNGNCAGDPNAGGPDGTCGDSLELIKDEDNCALEGVLTKDHCCSCPPLTINIKGSTTGNGFWDFTSELKKGAFDGLSSNGSPRLDDTSNDNIADNDTPLGGLVEVCKEVTYEIYRVENGNRIFEGTTTKLTDTGSGIFTDSSAETNITNIQGDSIGLEISDAGKILVISAVEFIFKLKSEINFPNECTYSPTEIGRYKVNGQQGYSNLSTELGTTLNSSDCRLPLFKWYKEGISSPFRKIYIDGNGVYSDKLTQFSEGLETCKTYILDVDCTCKDPITKYVDFCNPNPSGVTINFKDSSGCAICAKEVEFVIPKSCQINVDSGVVNTLLVDGAVVYQGVVTPSAFTYSHVQNSVIQSAEWKLYCTDGKEICNKLEVNSTVDVQWPLSATCIFTQVLDLTGQNVAESEITIPDYEGCAVTVVDSLGNIHQPGDVIKYSLSSSSQIVTFTVTSPCGPVGSYDVNIPAERDCNLNVTIADPCNCQNVNVVNGVGYFNEQIVINSSLDIETIRTLSILGVYDINGNLLTNLEFEKVLDDGNSVRFISPVFYHRVDIGYRWSGIDDINEVYFNFDNSCSCTGCNLKGTATNTAYNCGQATTIVIDPEGGVPPYTFSINGAPFNSFNILGLVGFGPETIPYTIKDAIGCEFTSDIFINCTTIITPAPTLITPIPTVITVPTASPTVPSTPAPSIPNTTAPTIPTSAPTVIITQSPTVGSTPTPTVPTSTPTVLPTCNGVPYNPSTNLDCCNDTVLYNPSSQECCGDGTVCNSIGCCTATSTPTVPTSTPTVPTSTPTVPTSTPTVPTSTPTVPTSTPTVLPTCNGVPYNPSTNLDCCNDTVLYNPSSQECCGDGTVCNSIGCCTATSTPTVPTSTPTVPTASPTVPTASPTVPTASPTVPTASPTVPTIAPTTPTPTNTKWSCFQGACSEDIDGIYDSLSECISSRVTNNCQQCTCVACAGESAQCNVSCWNFDGTDDCGCCCTYIDGRGDLCANADSTCNPGNCV